MAEAPEVPPEVLPVKQHAVLFVCLGNICRSTMAEGVFRYMASSPPYSHFVSRVDSCGTAGYHSGEPPDSRTMLVLKDHGIKDYVHAARKLRLSDFDEFDYIFAMDKSNLADVQREQKKKPNSKAKVMLFGEFSGKKKAEEVQDPYYGGKGGFELAYEKVARFSMHVLETFIESPSPRE